MDLFGSINLGDGRRKADTLLDQFPKKRHLQSYVKAFSALALGAASSLSFGLGLGDMETKSFLGQPLAANIELVSIENDVDFESLQVRQVHATEAEKMGVDIFYSSYKFDLKLDQTTGRPVINVVSNNSINEPYLNVLVELRWPSGVVYREYPLLLDPPPLVPVSQVEAKPSQNTTTGSARSSRPAAAPGQSTPTTSNTVNAIKPGAGDAYKVSSGDTLWSIAKRWREGTNLSVNDTMAWLHQNNPSAFSDGDMNRLKAGARMTMPDLSNFELQDGLLATPARSLVDTETEAPTQPVAAEGENQELAVEETQNVINDIDRSEQGLLVVSSDLQDDRSRELIDMLSRENEDLKQRMANIENSEYLNTLQELVAAQKRQIAELRTRLGEENVNSATDEVGAIVDESGLDLNSDSTTQTVTQLEDELASIDNDMVAVEEGSDSSFTEPVSVSEEEGLVELEPVLQNPPETEADKSLVTWLVFGAGAFLAMIFAFLLIYYRKVAPGKSRNDYDEDSVGNSFAYAGGIGNDTVKHGGVDKSTPLDYDGEDMADYTVVEGDNDWLGEKVEDVDSFDAGAFDTAIQEVEEIFDSIAVDQDDPESALEGMSTELPTEFKASDLEEEAKSKKERRSDDDVLSSIAAKMSNYKKTDTLTFDSNSGGFEIDEGEDHELDAVDATISRARMFCEFSQFDRARDLIEKTMGDSSDARYAETLSYIEAERLKSEQEQEIVEDQPEPIISEDVTQIEGFTTSLDDEDETDSFAPILDEVDSIEDDETQVQPVQLDDEVIADDPSEEFTEDFDLSFEDEPNEDSTEFVAADESDEMLGDEDNFAGGLLEDALNADFSAEAQEASMDLDLDIDLTFDDVDLEDDIQIEDDLDDQSKKKSRLVTEES